MKKTVDLRRMFLIAGLLALVISYALLWLRMVASRSEQTGADFIAFYAAGRVAQTAGMGKVYDAGLQQAIQQEEVGFLLAPGQVLLYNHAPYLIPLLGLIVDGNYIASFSRWVILLIIFFVTSAGVMARLLMEQGIQRRNILITIAGALTFFPLFVSLLNGQDTAVLFLGASLWLAGLLLDRDPLAGLGLALTTIRPNIALFLAVPFLFRRRRVFLWFCAGTLALAIVSVWILGVEGVRTYLGVLLASAGGEWYGMKEAAMVNLIGLLRRVAPGLEAGVVRSLGWGAYLLGLAGACLLWARSREIRGRRAGLAVVLAVFTVPHLHYHDLTLLLIPLLSLILVLAREKFLEERTAVLLPLGFSLVLLFSNFLPVLKFNLPYLVMLLLGLALWHPEKLLPARSPASD
jgi:hypothetical protein